MNANSSPATVVITRPSPDHLNLMASLAGLNIQVIHAPAFELVAMPLGAGVEQYGLLHQCDGIIVVSPMAARMVLKRFDLNTLRDRVFFAPGRATAAVLHLQHLDVRIPAGHGTSEAMLEMPDFEQIAGKRYLILNASGGRRLLAETLKARGAQIVEAEVYQRRPLRLPEQFLRLLRGAINHGTDMASLISSKAAFDHWCSSLKETHLRGWLSGGFVVSSLRLEKHLKAAGVDWVVVAKSASDDDMLNALEQSGML